MEKKPTVIYIISDRRSGSTLLENMLSKSPEVVSVGELALLQGHILQQGPGDRWNWNCSCGNPVGKCVFWSGILKETYQKSPSLFNTSLAWNYKSKMLLAVAVAPAFFKKKLLQILSSSKNKNVAATLANLYGSIFKHSGKPYIIDSSKDPMQALCIYRSKRDFDVKIIWLTRDLRAVAVSKNKWKELNVKKQKTLKKILFDVFYYKRLCRAAATFIKPEDLISIKYESLAQHTQPELDSIIVKFGMEQYTAPEYMFVEDDHTIAGTPNRFSKRPVVYEEKWKRTYDRRKMLYFTGNLMNKL